MKKIISFILATIILLSGCSTENKPFNEGDIEPEAIETEQTEEAETAATEISEEPQHEITETDFPWTGITFEHDWQTVYAEYLSDINKSVRYVYIDDITGNGIPEVMLFYEDITKILSYENNELAIAEFAWENFYEFQEHLNEIYSANPIEISPVHNWDFDSLDIEYKNGVMINVVLYLNDKLFNPRVPTWKNKEFENDWQRAYSEFLENKFDYYFGYMRVSIFDINNDNIPEMFITAGENRGMLYYYDNKIHLIKMWGGMSCSFNYNEETGQIFTSDWSSGIGDMKIYDYIDGKYETTLSILLKKRYDLMGAGDGGGIRWTHYINDVEIGTFHEDDEEWKEVMDEWGEKISNTFSVFGLYCHEHDAHESDLSCFTFPFTSFTDVKGDWNSYFEENLF